VPQSAANRLYVVWDCPGMPGLHGLVWVTKFQHFEFLCVDGTLPGSGTKLKRVYLTPGPDRVELGETAARAVYQGGGSNGLFTIQYELPQKPLRWYIAVW
jgi:hypothetical protein